MKMPLESNSVESMLAQHWGSQSRIVSESALPLIVAGAIRGRGTEDLISDMSPEGERNDLAEAIQILYQAAQLVLLVVAIIKEIKSLSGGSPSPEEVRNRVESESAFETLPNSIAAKLGKVIDSMIDAASTRMW
jgi:hypothetical protein